MLKKSIIKITLTIFALVLMGSMDVSAQKKTDCANTTDDQTVKAIYDRMKVKYDDQIIHINVTVKDGAATLVGEPPSSRRSRACRSKWWRWRWMRGLSW